MADELIDGLTQMAATPLYALKRDLLLAAAAEIGSVRAERDVAKRDAAVLRQKAATPNAADAERWRYVLDQMAAGQIDPGLLAIMESVGKAAPAQPKDAGAAPAIDAAAGEIAAAVDRVRGKAADAPGKNK